MDDGDDPASKVEQEDRLAGAAGTDAVGATFSPPSPLISLQQHSRHHVTAS